MVLLLDNFDSFTYNLLDYIQQLGLQCEVLRNDVSIDLIKEKDYQAIIFSPGPGKPADSGIMPELIEKFHTNIPLLGICLGHQAIGEYFGATLEKASIPMHGKISLIETEKDDLFRNLPKSFNVVRYHSLLLTNLPSEIKAIANTLDQQIMAIKHKKYPCYGIQFHPEAHLTEFGLDILRNWAILYNLIG